MKTTKKMGVLIGSLTSLSLVLAACAPAPSNQIVSGQIAAFADEFPSTFVNGVRYDISQTTIMNEGVATDWLELTVGMKTKMDCHPKDRSADNIYAANMEGNDKNCDRIEIVDEVEGEVLSVNLNTNQVGTMNIMGQTVNIKAETVFKSKVKDIDNINQILPGMIVEIYGDTDGVGNISATRAELKKTKLAEYLLGNKDGVKIKGIVANLDTTTQTFQVRGAMVDYSTAVMELKNGVLDNGLAVKVYAKTPVGPGGTVTATKLKLKNKGKYGEHGNEGQEMEIHGEVSSDFSGEKFKVNGQTIYIDDNTVFDGITQAELTEGMEVEVKGVFRRGRFVATYIGAGASANARVIGTITDISPTGINSGSIVVLGSTYIINNETVMLFNGEPVSQSLLNLGGLDVNDVVTVDYYIDPETQENIAVKVSR